LSAQRAQNINACVSDTLPDAMNALKSKTKLRCAEIVEGGDLLWMGLEIEGEIQETSTAKDAKVPKENEGRE
jgi:hypothetical protein